VSGVVTVLARRGEVHRCGRDDGRRRQRPARHGILFRITSMAKAVAAAAIILAGECRLRLDEPVDRLVPNCPAAGPSDGWTGL
jgi:CubicO group peptidase (beta-lactamase class C family)